MRWEDIVFFVVFYKTGRFLAYGFLCNCPRRNSFNGSIYFL